ncbi:MAG: SCO family protein [Anaerolineae bacterium]|nr:SCO family protein [Anaerolineae bacterium]NUQ05455.1 SCO family protein [Anaerolineae bacterium]
MAGSDGAIQQRRMIVVGVLVCIIFLFGIGALLFFRSQLDAPTPTPTPSSGVTIIDPPRALVDFTLPGRNGAPLALSDLRGRFTLIFFGYTHCPDFCPTTLAEFRQVKRALDAQADQLQFLFISVDGERDTPAVLEEYVARFDPQFLFMRGDTATLARISADYGLYYELRKETPEDIDYVVDHTTPSYLVDPEGRMIAVFSFTAEPEVIVETIRGQF